MPTDVAGVTIIDIEPDRDDRGFFSNLFCADEFAEYGLLFNVAQTSVAYNYARGTLRGIHRQVPPNAVATLVRCTRGAIAGVAVDVRPESDTYGRHVIVQLSADNRRALFLPPYVAHGFQTLADNTEVLYQVSGVYDTAEEQGFRWDEPEFGIEWPLAVSVISERDASWPLLASVKNMTLLAGRNVSADGKRRATSTASHDTLAPQIAQPARYERETRPAWQFQLQGLLPGRHTVLIVAGGNVVLSMASTVTGPVNWPTVASLHRKQLIA
jgi:dTDP-4-dehydrorhamnose 3,5-epimerase